MPDLESTISLIHDQLRRLGCRDIELSASTECVDGLLHRKGETIQVSLEIAHRALLPLVAESGDEVAWSVLREHNQLPE